MVISFGTDDVFFGADDIFVISMVFSYYFLLFVTFLGK